MIRRKGTIVSVGNASGAVPPFARKPLRSFSVLCSDVFAALKLGEKNIKVCRPVYVLLSLPEHRFPLISANPVSSPLTLAYHTFLPIFSLFRVFNYVETPEENHKYTTELWDLIAQGKLKINIFKEYPFTLEGIRQTHLDIVSHSTVGKLIVKVA